MSLRRGSVGSTLARQQIAEAANGREQIVEVVRDAAGELADRVHLLRLAHLLLEPAALGHVARHGEHFADEPRLRIAHRLARRLEPDVVAVAPAHAIRQRLDALVAEQARASPRASTSRSSGWQYSKIDMPDEIGGGVAEQREAHRRRVEDRAVRRLARQHVRRMLGEKAIALLALAQRDLGASCAR